MGSSLLHYDLSLHSSGFAKKTFISYAVTFKENFRQGLVVEIDLEDQTVLLEGGEVSTAGVGLSVSWLQGGPDGTAAGRRRPGWVSSRVKRVLWPPSPTWCWADGRFLMSEHWATAATRVWWQTFPVPFLCARHCLKPFTISLNTCLGSVRELAWPHFT